MNRRTFFMTAVAGAVTAGIAGTAAATSYFPTMVDQSLFRESAC